MDNNEVEVEIPYTRKDGISLEYVTGIQATLNQAGLVLRFFREMPAIPEKARVTVDMVKNIIVRETPDEAPQTIREICSEIIIDFNAANALKNILENVRNEAQKMGIKWQQEQQAK